MTKMTGYENTYYPDRWEHKGKQVCQLRDGVYLFFKGTYERSTCSLDCAVEDEIVIRFSSLSEAEQYIDKLCA